jgi:hypothetical protein
MLIIRYEMIQETFFDVDIDPMYAYITLYPESIKLSLIICKYSETQALLNAENLGRCFNRLSGRTKRTNSHDSDRNAAFKTGID